MRNLLIVLAIVTTASLSFADTVIVQKVETSSIMGQPAVNTIQTMKIKGSKSRIDHQNKAQYQIVDLANKKVYIVDPEKKETMVVALDMMNAAAGMLKQLSQGAQMEVKNTGQTRTVNGFKCTDYIVSMGGALALNSKQCVTTDVDYSDFEAFRPYAEGIMKMFTSEKDAPKLPPGIAAQTVTEMNMMGQKVNSKTELQSVKKEEVPASVFELPAGHTVKEAPGMPKQ